MITDAQDMFSEAQTVAAVASAINSTNVIDTSAIVRDLGAGKPLYFIAQFDEAVTSGGSATLQIQLVESAAANLSTPTVLYDSGAVAYTVFIINYRIQIALPRVAASLRYMGVIYTIAVATTTAGKITSFLSDGGQDRATYKPGFTVN